MKLRELLIKIFEGQCERLPNESDSDYLQRCGNGDFARQAKIFYQQRVGTFRKPNLVRERNKRK